MKKFNLFIHRLKRRLPSPWFRTLSGLQRSVRQFGTFRFTRLTALIALVSLSTYLILSHVSTPQAPHLKNGRGDTLYSASNSTYSTTIGTKDGSSKIGFSVGESKVDFVLAGSDKVAPKKASNTTVLFPSVLPNTDLKYTTTPNGVKEEIILNQKQDNHIFLFDLTLKNIFPKKFTNEFIDPTFKDTSGTYQFHFEKPFAVDASGARTNDVLLQIGEDKGLPGKYYVKLIVDPAWLKDGARTYPISIDPTIVHDTTAEFAAGQLNRLKDTGSGSTPNLETYYQELPADPYTVGLWHMNEASGNALDSSGNSLTGTPTGTTVVSGLLSNARSFNGTSDFIQISDNAVLNNIAKGTAEFWYKPNYTGAPGSTRGLFGKSSTNVSVELYGVYHYTDGHLWLDLNGAGAVDMGAFSPISGTWYHLAFTWDGVHARSYVNGVLLATQATTNGSGTSARPFFIGAVAYNSEAGKIYGLGSIDEFRLSNIARTPEQIKSSASRRPYSTYTSDVIDLSDSVVSWNPLTWTELGVNTGDGETLKSSNGLVAQWNFNETSGTSADNAEGTAALDGTLSGFDSTASQDADPDSSWTANNKRWGSGALQFDGTDSKVTITDNSLLEPTALTIESWVKTSQSGTNFVGIVDKYTGSTAGYTLDFPSGTTMAPRLNVHTSSGQTVTGTRTLNDGQWHHIVGTYDGSNCKIYIDGILNNTATCTGTITYDNANLVIGGDGVSTNYFRGTIDSTRIYSRVLSPSEIMSNYQAGNIELQTRVGSDTSPDDGSWSAWSPTTGETTIDNMNNPLDYATPSASIFTGPLIATSTATFPVIEGNKSLKLQSGQTTSLTSVVGLWHLDETGGSGAYLKDSSANANHGTPTGTSPSQGISGKGRRFNGSSDLIALSSSTGLINVQNDYSVEAWIYPTNTNSVDIYSQGNSGNNNPDFEFYIGSGNLTYYVRNDAGTSITNSVAGIITNKWNHVVFTKTGTTHILYVNSSATSFTSTTPSNPITFTNTTLGASIRTSTNGYFPGKIDEVRISNVARSAEEIAESYRMGRDHYVNKTISSTDLSGKTTLPFYVAADRPGTYLSATIGESAFANYQPDSNTLGLWHLDEQSGSGAYIKDSSGNSYHGTPGSGATTIQGKVGPARTFNATSNASIDLPDSARMNAASGFTFNAWIKTTVKGTATNQRPLYASKVSGSEIGFTITNPTTGKINFNASNGSSTIFDISGTTDIADGNWHMVTATWDGTTGSNKVQLYIDGKIEASGTSTASGGTENGGPCIGIYPTNVASSGCAYSLAADGYFSGIIDEVRRDNIQRTATEIRQAYEIGQRTHPITIDFASAISHSDPLSNSSDLTFTLMATPSGTTNAGDNLFKGDKIIVRENYNDTEYIAQGIVDSVNISSGATTVSSWDAGSTFPSVGYTPNASVFKWQREYWNISGEVQDSSLDAITNLTLRLTDGNEGRTIYLDDLRSNSDYLTTPSGSTITSSTGNRYLQYRAILSSFDEAVTATLSAVTLDYVTNSSPTTPSLNAPANTATNQLLSPVLQTTSTDSDSDYLRYKIELCTNVGMTTGCQTFDQTSSQTGWSGQNAQTSTAYTSGTQATYTLQSPLSVGTTYYWRSYAIDPGGTNTWSGTQGTPYSFTTTSAPLAPTTPYAEGSSNPSGVIDTTPEFSAIHNDSDSDSANYYEIEVNTNNTFTGTVMWDTGAVSMASLANGVRSTDVSYAGTSIPLDGAGTVYYWRIRFTDVGGATGAWSTTQSFTMNLSPGSLTLDLPTDSATNQILSTVLKTTGTDSNSDYLRYKIELCTNVGMTTGCQTFDQTSSQTGWSGQNAQTSTAYTSGTQATYTLQSPLSVGTTYYWRSYAIDPGGTNTWSSTQGTPYSFTTISAPETASGCRLQENSTDTSITVIWTDNALNENGYQVQRSVDGGAFTTIAGSLSVNTTSYTDSTITSGHTYAYRVTPYFTGPILGAYCTTAPTGGLNLQLGTFKIN